jgi:hypothetical protein
MIRIRSDNSQSIIPVDQQRFLVTILIIGTALLCYSPNLHNFFVAEDMLQVWSTNFSYLLHQFFPDTVAGYRPLMYVWWWAGYNLFGYHPFAFRWIVLILHAVNGVLLYALTQTITGSRVTGLLAAFLYLPLPIHSDALNWLSASSNEVTCGFFYFLSLRLYLRYRQACHDAQRSKIFRLRAGAILSMLCALGTNEIALTLPFVLALVDFTTLPLIELAKHPYRQTIETGIKRISPFFFIWILFVVVRTFAVHGIGGYGAEVHLRAGEYLFQTSQEMARMILLPFSMDPGFSSTINSIFASRVLLLFTVSVLCAIFWNGRAGLWMFVLAALPILNIPAYHRLYIPVGGLAIMVSTSMVEVIRLLHPQWRRLAIMTSLILISGVFIRQFNALVERNQEWTRASTITAFVPIRTHELVPAVPPKTVFYYYGLPENLGNGVQVFSWGLKQVIQATYNDRSLQAFRVQMNATPVYNLERDPKEIPQQSVTETNQLFFVFDAQQLKLEQYPRDKFITTVESAANTP